MALVYTNCVIFGKNTMIKIYDIIYYKILINLTIAFIWRKQRVQGRVRLREEGEDLTPSSTLKYLNSSKKSQRCDRLQRRIVYKCYLT